MVSLVYFYPYYNAEETRVWGMQTLNVATGHASVIKLLTMLQGMDLHFRL